MKRDMQIGCGLARAVRSGARTLAAVAAVMLMAAMFELGHAEPVRHGTVEDGEPVAAGARQMVVVTLPEVVIVARSES
jgi:hypothetical protein